jgi:hypothetical protein
VVVTVDEHTAIVVQVKLIKNRSPGGKWIPHTILSARMGKEYIQR